MTRFERYGVLGTEKDGVFFTEAVIPNARPLGTVKASTDRQNATLDVVKANLASQVRAKGGNCLMEFKYAQKATIFSFSSTQLYATGQAADV